MTSTTDDGDVTAYVYNASNQVISSTYDGVSTAYEYSGGRLSTAFDGTTEATFIYTSGNIPSRVNLLEDGVNAGYWIIENTDGNITKIELHDADDVVSEVTVATYTGGALSTILVQSYNYDTEEFETGTQVSGITNDGKSNPYNTNFALIYANIDNPLILGKNNLTGGNLVFGGENIPFTIAHTYNTNNYPLISTITIPGLGSNTVSYVYDCK
jgi:hypothetical protein